MTYGEKSEDHGRSCCIRASGRGFDNENGTKIGHGFNATDYMSNAGEAQRCAVFFGGGATAGSGFGEMASRKRINVVGRVINPVSKPSLRRARSQTRGEAIILDISCLSAG